MFSGVFHPFITLPRSRTHFTEKWINPLFCLLTYTGSNIEYNEYKIVEVLPGKAG